MYDEDDDEYDTDDYVAPRGLSLGKSPFAAMLGRAKESNGAFVYDTAGRSIRRDGGRPLTDEAEAQYAQQSGALDQLAQRFGVQRTKADDSEKWLSVAAALFAPTQTGKTSESIARALGAYATATGDQKKEERSTSLALAKLMQRYESDAMRAEALGVRAARAAAKDAAPKPVAWNPVTGDPSEPMTGAKVAIPSEKAMSMLEAAPTDENIAAYLERFPRFEQQIVAAAGRGRQRMGGQ